MTTGSDVHEELAEALEHWLTESADEDLTVELRRLVDELGQLGVWIAAGALARLELPSPQGRAQLIERLRRGELPGTDPQRTWAAEHLDERSGAELEDTVRAVVRVLEDEMAELEASKGVRPGRLMRACERRDDLESLRALLAAGCGADQIDGLLAACDERGGHLVDALERDRATHVEFVACVRLERAMSQFPEAWWIACARIG